MQQPVSPVRPSQLHALLQCPASLRMQSAYPELGDQTSAEEGTAAHWAMAKLLTPSVSTPPKVGEVAPNGIVLTEEMIEGALEVYYDVVNTVGPSWQQFVIVESPVTMHNLYPGMWGTPDVRAQLTPRLRYTWDLKFGFRYVEVFENPQLVAYGSDDFRPQDPNMVHVFKIVQPRSFHREGTTRAWRVFDKDLEPMRASIRIAAQEAKSPNAKLVTGPACHDCTARHVCPALQQKAYEACEASLYGNPIEMSAQAVGLELRHLWDAFDRLKSRISGLEAQAESLLRSGSSISHLTMEPGRGSTRWNVTDEQMIEVGKLLGFNLEKPRRAITPKQAKDLGLDPAFVSVYATHTPGQMQLKPFNDDKARKVFGYSEPPKESELWNKS